MVYVESGEKPQHLAEMNNKQVTTKMVWKYFKYIYFLNVNTLNVKHFWRIGQLHVF